jgi:tetratricopeptide (TPR) repeat protein
MGRMVEAEKLSLTALQEAEKLGNTSPKLADVLIFVARMYHQKGDPEKAVSFTERALAIDEKTLGPDHPSVARDLNNLAQYQQSPAKAEKYWRRVVEIVEESAEMDSFNRVMLLNNAAAFYRYQERNIEAETLLKHALEIAESSGQTTGVDVIRADLASLYRSEGKEGEAEKIFRDAVAAGNAANGKGSNQDSGSLNAMRLAQQYKEDGRLQDAEEYYNRALVAMEQSPDPNSRVLLPQALDQLGDLYHSEGRDPEAENLFLRALDLGEKGAGPKRPDLARNLSFPFALLSFYRDQGRLSEMEPVFQRALAIQERVLGPEDASVSETLIQLARVYREEGKKADALLPYQRSVQIAEKNLARDDSKLAYSRLADILREYAGLLQEVGREAEAARMRARADQAGGRNAAQNGKN